MRIGSFNVRGITLDEEKQSIATDFNNYRLDVLCIQETHLVGTKTLELRGEKGNKVRLFHTGTDRNRYHGVGIIVDSNRKALFKRISDRICFVKLIDCNVVVICAYSPTNQNTKENPENTQNFYSALNDTLNSFSSSTQVFIAADFNSQIGTHHKDYPELIGRYYKGNKVDKNSEFLINFLLQNQLVVTNTKFKHKLAHITTWECNNKYRYNPVRNQIDFVLCKSRTFSSVTNSRSYNGPKTSSDHRLVICDIPKFKWHKIFLKSKAVPKINCDRLINNPEIKDKYRNKVSESLENKENQQERWNNIVHTCIEAAKETAGIKEKKKPLEHKDLELLSQQQQKLRLDINSQTDRQARVDLRKERNRVLKQLKKRKKQIEIEILEDKINLISLITNPDRKAYEAIRSLNKKEQINVVVNNVEGEIVTDSEQKNINNHYIL